MDKSSKKISLLSSFDGTTGGPAINAAVLSCEFSKRGYTVTDICFNKKHINLELCGEIKSLGVPFVKQIKNSFLNTIIKPLQFTVGIISLYRAFYGREKQNIICFGWGASLLALSAKILFGMKNMDIICRVGTRFEEEFAAEKSSVKKAGLRVADAMIRLLYKKASVVSPISRHLEKFLIEKYGVSPSKIKVLYNPRDEREISLLAKEEPEGGFFTSGIPTLVTCGRLAVPKGHWHLIRAFNEVRKKIPCRLLIIGDGDLKDYLVEMVKDLGIGKDALFTGWQKNPFKYFSRADVFVLNSSWEGFANVILEAMICGLPVVSSDCYSGPRELLAPETDLNKQTDEIEYGQYGILVPVDDRNFCAANDPLNPKEEILSKAILEIMTNASLRTKYREKSLTRAKDFNLEKVINDWLNVLS